MGVYNAFYIRKRAAADMTRSAILNLYPAAAVATSKDFIGGVLSSDDHEPPEHKLSVLSAELETDIIWVAYSTVTESFIFHHWRAGSHLRALEYGCASEGTWDRVEGQAEAWEREAFWSEEDLISQLDCVETDGERRKLQKLWKAALLIKGETAPSAGSDSAVEAIMQHYGLFAEGELQQFQPSRPAYYVTQKQRIGCLLFVLFFTAAFIFAIHYGHYLTVLVVVVAWVLAARMLFR